MLASLVMGTAARADSPPDRPPPAASTPAAPTPAAPTLAPSAPAPAASVASTDATAADAAFARGLSSFEAKHYAEAIATWEALATSLGEERGFRVLYNLGLAYEAEGDPTRAIERFEGFLRHLAAQSAELSRDLEERRQDAAERARALKSTRAGVLFPAPRGRECTVTIDGGPPRAAGFTAYVAPGEHTIELFSGSPDARKLRVTASLGRVLTVDTTPPAPPPPAPPPPRLVLVAPPESPPDFPTPWVLGGGALCLLSFGLPLGLGVHASSLRDDAEKLGPGHTQYSDALRRFDDAREAYRTAYLLPAALGAATLTVAAVFLVRVRTYRPASDKPRAALSLTLGGAWLDGSF